MPFLGELAALATAVCWSFTSLFFAAAGRRIGSFTVNMIRIVMAVLLLAAVHTVVYGMPWPTITEAHHGSLALLAVSGLVGLLIGDSCYFAALVMIGPKLSTLMMSTYPVYAALIAWLAYSERLGWLAVVGIILALGGVIIAVIGRRPSKKDLAKPKLWPGVLLGFLGALGQAVGIVIAKSALNRPTAEAAIEGRFDTLSGTLIRMVVAMIAIWLIAAWQLHRNRRAGKAQPLGRALKDGRAVWLTFLGAFFGPVVGVWLSLIAIVNAEVGIATTIMASIPIIVIPQVWILEGERPGLLELVGAAVTVTGVSLLFIRA